MPARMLRDLFAEIARDVAHLRDPVPVIRQRLERSSRRVANIRPESRIRVRRHFVVTEFLIGDEILYFRSINIVVDLLLRRELRARNIIELVQHVLPVFQPHFLRRKIDFRQAIGNRFRDSFEPGKLIQPPFPFVCVDRPQPFICALRLGKTRNAPQRCSTKQDGGFDISSCLAQQRGLANKEFRLIYLGLAELRQVRTTAVRYPVRHATKSVRRSTVDSETRLAVHSF